MKKVVIGCLVVGVLAAILAAFAGYYFIYRPARTYIASFQQIGEVDEIENRIENKAPFTGPETGELTEAQVERFVQAASQIHARLGARAETLKAKYDEIQKGREGSDRSFGETLGAFKDLVEFFVEGKRAQVDALNQAEFSLDEYNWVREKVFAAAGLVLTQVDLTELSRAAGGETPDLEPKEAGGGEPVPEQNRALVAPHVEKLREYLPWAFFGL